MWICKELTFLGIVQHCQTSPACLITEQSPISPAMLLSAACHDRVRAWAKLQPGPGLTNGGAARQSADQSEMRWGRISQSVISCGDAWAGCLLLSYKQLLIGMTYCHAQRWTHPPLPASYPSSGMPYITLPMPPSNKRCVKLLRWYKMTLNPVGAALWKCDCLMNQILR